MAEVNVGQSMLFHQKVFLSSWMNMDELQSSAVPPQRCRSRMNLIECSCSFMRGGVSASVNGSRMMLLFSAAQLPVWVSESDMRY